MLAGLLTDARADAPAACAGKVAPPGPVRAVTGTFDTSVEGAYVMVPFDVPDGATRIHLRLCHDQPPTPLSAQIKHTLDLGLWEPDDDPARTQDAFRGWGGSSRPEVVLTREVSTTVGYKPGPLPPGEWAAEIGVAAVAGVEEGDPDGSVAWRLEISAGFDPADADDPWEPAPYDDTPRNAEAGWYKGDFHVHARHSNPNDAEMQDVFNYAFGDRPDGAGLDFITLSDYVTDRQWDEIGRFQHQFPDKLIVRSAEVITYLGHVNNHASLTQVDHRTGDVYELRHGSLTLLREARPASTIFDDIHASGLGWTQVNHPTTFPSKVPGFGNLCRGCSWEYTDDETDWTKVDAMEVSTGPAGYTDPKGNEPGPNPFTPPAIEWWDRLRRDGHDITAVGSSDSHKADREELTASPIGEATTVVYAPELSEQGIRAGILAGHAYLKFFSSDGPDLRFEAVGPGETAIMGDELSSAIAVFTARVIGGAPAAESPQPRELVVLRDGVPILVLPVTSADFSFSFEGVLRGDYRLQLQRGSAIEALTNPITLRTP
jgi:hypothetical protein